MLERIRIGWRAGLRTAIGLGILTFCLVWAANHFAPIDLRAVTSALFTGSAWPWLGACVATAASFATLAQYDVVAHRHLKTGYTARNAARAGAAAVALSQCVGMGLATGTAARWRLLPGLGVQRAAAVTTLVSLSFMIALTVLLLLFNPMGHLALSLTGIVLFGALSVIALRTPSLNLGRWALRLPTIRACLSFLVLAAGDTLCAAVVLACFLPQVPLGHLYPVYLLALGAGLAGGTPGGVGPFEMTLSLSLPHVPPAELAAALLGYRAIYQAMPAAIATLDLMTRAKPHHAVPPLDMRAPQQGQRAEHLCALQNGAVGLSAAGSSGAVLIGAQSHILFLGAASGPLSPLLPAIRQTARQNNRVACAYKLTPRDAVLARRAGWRVCLIAQEACLPPTPPCFSGPEHRQMRRLLRKADQARLRTRPISLPDWPALGRINRAWMSAHGAENGLTMGRFDPRYLSHQDLYGAYRGDQLIAFISILRHPTTPTVDLMRSLPGHPPGTMQALILHAQADCADRGQHLSLAAVPANWLLHFAPGRSGLKRFKHSFSPKWRPLYMAAPNWPAMALSAWDIWRGVHNPPPLTEIQQDNEYFAFEPTLQPCKTRPKYLSDQTGHRHDGQT